jgi:hypothetical protein
MANWTASFKLPQFTDDAFEKKHDEYVKQNGYVIRIPAWDEIIHYKTFKPLTKDEENFYFHHQQQKIPEERLSEITSELKRRKDKYEAMLGTPLPRQKRNIGAIAIAIDNAQDALSTIGVIGMIAGAIAGGPIAAALAAPVGAALTGAALLNLINPMKWMKFPKILTNAGRAAKIRLHQQTDKNPFSKKSRAAVLKRMKNFRPSMPNLIEALQVTDNIFGIGICLGPIVGLAQDVMSGTLRMLNGDKVTVKSPPSRLPLHAITAAKGLKGQAMMHAFAFQSDHELEAISMISGNLSMQAITPYMATWNPFDMVNDLEHVEIEAPTPTDPLTLTVIKNMGADINEVCNWPQTNKRWISLVDLFDSTWKQAGANLKHFAEQNPNDGLAWTALQNANDFALGTIEAIEGPGSVQIEFSIIERIVSIILDQGWMYPPDITAAQIEKFEDWCYAHEYMNTMPTYRDIYRYPQVFCGFTWMKDPNETR